MITSKSIVILFLTFFFLIPLANNTQSFTLFQSRIIGSIPHKKCKISLDTIHCIVIREVLLMDSFNQNAGYSDCRSRLIQIPTLESTHFIDTLDFTGNDFSKKKHKKAPETAFRNKLKLNDFFDYFYFRYGNKNGGATFYEYLTPSAKKYNHIMAVFSCKMIVWIYRNCNPIKTEKYYQQSGYFIGQGDNDCWNTREFYYYSDKMAVVVNVDTLALINPAQVIALKLRKSKFKLLSRSL